MQPPQGSRLVACARPFHSEMQPREKKTSKTTFLRLHHERTEILKIIYGIWYKKLVYRSSDVAPNLDENSFWLFDCRTVAIGLSPSPTSSENLPVHPHEGGASRRIDPPTRTDVHTIRQASSIHREAAPTVSTTLVSQVI